MINVLQIFQLRFAFQLLIPSVHFSTEYFATGKIEKNQVESLAERKSMSVQEIEKWMSPVLAYDLDNVNAS